MTYRYIANVLHPVLYEYWHKILLQQNVIKAEETRLQVIENDTIQSYMWVYCSGADTSAGNIHDVNYFDMSFDCSSAANSIQQ